MSSREISDKTKKILWGVAAGRCEKCGRLVYKHPLGDEIQNFAQMAHIYPFSDNGPRREEKIKTFNENGDINDISNLMLLCYDCHEAIDENPQEHPVALLKKLKKDFEEFIVLATNYDRVIPTVAVTYSANLHEQRNQFFNERKLKDALRPDKYVKALKDLSLQNSEFQVQRDNILYWAIEKENLTRLFDKDIRPYIENDCINLSVFALAPIPLLVLLGALLTNKHDVDVYQYKKDLASWQNDFTKAPVKYNCTRHGFKIGGNDVILALSVSSKVKIENIRAAISLDNTFYEISSDNPTDDVIGNREDMSCFFAVYRKMREEIWQTHGRGTKIHIFGAIPISIAVEIGRQYNRNSDMPIVTYDFYQNTYKKIYTIGEDA